MDAINSNNRGGAIKKPKGRMTAYTYFVQTCREEHRKSHPSENVNFTEFSKKCAERWKEMTENEKKRFADMADKDKERYEAEMAVYTRATWHTSNESYQVSRKKKKDPNAPKRPLSAFFIYCADERPGLKAIHPGYSVGEMAKELGDRWNKIPPELKVTYETRAQQDKKRYEMDMDAYRHSLPPPVIIRSLTMEHVVDHGC
jgi:hypothetical protein